MPETHQPIIVIIFIIYSVYLLKDHVELQQYISGRIASYQFQFLRKVHSFLFAGLQFFRHIFQIIITTPTLIKHMCESASQMQLNAASSPEPYLLQAHHPLKSASEQYSSLIFSTFLSLSLELARNNASLYITHTSTSHSNLLLLFQQSNISQSAVILGCGTSQSGEPSPLEMYIILLTALKMLMKVRIFKHY